LAALQFNFSCCSSNQELLAFGDVTCTFVVALAVAWLGVTTTLIWWCLMGILGVIGIAVFARRNGSIAFCASHHYRHDIGNNG
jgi:hypothetical protein